jgi:alkaline phosphatase D
MKRRSALKASSLAAIGLTATINGGCSKNTFYFNHGVASGDPLSDQVILWTRVTPEQPGPIEVILEVSSSSDFNNIAFTKSLKTSSLTDYTVKYDFSIQDIFQSGEIFYYRFKAGTAISESGKTKTLALNINKVKIGVFSCSNFPAGFFNAYQAAAEKNDLDLWLHLGDYLYEYPMGGYATSNAKKLGRVPSPLHEIITLADYRERHAQYKLDHGSKALHSNAPIIAVWDDHEFSNDTWKKGAENHAIDGSEGDFYARRSAAIKAYHEWMPIREQQNKRKIFREFKIGKLIQLLMLDTRQYERDKQIQPKDYLSDSGFNEASFYSDLNSLDRKLLGKEQLAWIEEKMTAEDFKWTVMGQQVLMTKLKFPD